MHTPRTASFLPLHASSLSGIRPLCVALLVAGMLSACGGGGGGGGDSASNPPPNGNPQQGGVTPPPDGNPPQGGNPPANVAALPAAVPASVSMTMSCPDGNTWQCSGDSIIRLDNGNALTSSGVQTYGRSTSDMLNPNPTATGAFGLAPVTGGPADVQTGGLAEVRINRNAQGLPTNAALLLSNLGLQWDAVNERPPIIETFNTSYGRTVLGPTRALQEATLPAETDLTFFNYRYANLGATATQANYANNRYFPRNFPSRCPDPQPVGGCPTTETTGLNVTAGDWRTGGAGPDQARAVRVHGDGDVHAGNGPSDASGNPTIIVGGTGPGIPFPGSKGYRELSSYNLQYANLATWLTQDTVLIREWTTSGEEHNKNRRGAVAYGEVTDPATVPASGSATYAGTVHGWYGTGVPTEDPAPFTAGATLTVNFATRQVSIVVQNAIANNGGAALPLNFTAAAGLGAAGTNVANYLTAPLTAGSLTGGLGGRLFGAVAGGGSGAGPAEVAGTLTLTNAGSGATAVAGFIARKQ